MYVQLISLYFRRGQIPSTMCVRKNHLHPNLLWLQKQSSLTPVPDQSHLRDNYCTFESINKCVVAVEEPTRTEEDWRRISDLVTLKRLISKETWLQPESLHYRLETFHYGISKPKSRSSPHLHPKRDPWFTHLAQVLVQQLLQERQGF